MAEPSMLATMCGRIRHRGPDDEGIYLDGFCGIGMRRLSIIDLQTGHQPLSNEDGTVWVVFNGEIYNFQALRAELVAQGHRFTTATDTEVLVHLYEQYGTDGIQKLRGMFAFAIWDAGRRRILLVRDRFGKKPLYYCVVGDSLYFASELKSLRLPGVPLDLDREAVQLYFQFGYIPDPYTVFAEIRRLPAGSWLTYDSDGNLARGQYWTMPRPSAEHHVASEEATASRVRASFDEAVRIRMVADVPLGAFLSGGLDSSSVVASMALQSDEPIKTFSIGFEESGFNELPYASLVAKMYGTDHHEIVVRPDSVELVERLIEHFDEPFADESAIPTYIVSKFAAQYVKVALTGDGGDELFAGYDSFQDIGRRRIFDRLPLAVRHLISTVADSLPYSAYGKNYLRMLSRSTALDRYFESNYTPYFLRQALLQPEWMFPGDSAYLKQVLSDCFLPNGSDVLLQAMFFETRANLIGDMLVKVDRASMANSLEVRCPLLDHELAEMAASLPPSLKIRGGRGKYILAHALGDRLPPELLSRQKTGFGVPLAAWFRGPLREMLSDNLTARSFLDRGIVSEKFVRGLLAEHLVGRRDNSNWLWSLLMLGLWLSHSEREYALSN